MGTKKVHSIFNYAGSNLDHSKNVMCETDQLTHLYTLIVNNADNTYEVRVDGEKKESGSTLADWPILKPKQINDPAASKPEDWDDEDDGEWEAPMIDNPEYKGEWKA